MGLDLRAAGLHGHWPVVALHMHHLIPVPRGRTHVTAVYVKLLHLGGRGGFGVNFNVAIKVRLVTCAVVADGANERFFARVGLHVTIQQGLAQEGLVTRLPGADVAVLVELLVVYAHVRLPEEGYVAADVRRGEPFVHRDHVTFQIVTAVGEVAALGIPARKRFILSVLALWRGQLC